MAIKKFKNGDKLLSTEIVSAGGGSISKIFLTIQQMRLQ